FFGNAGTGSITHLTLALFNHEAGLSLSAVPYKGTAEALQGLARNDVQLVAASMGTARALVNSGKIKPIGVAANKRMESAPDLRTMEESTSVSLDVATWN